jgi:hypothetical protein
MGIDSATHKIYLPSADYDETKPKAIPGTFKILVIAQNAVR